MNARSWTLALAALVLGSTGCLGGGAASGGGGSGTVGPADVSSGGDATTADSVASADVGVDVATADAGTKDAATAADSAADAKSADTASAGPDPAIVAIQAQIDALTVDKTDPKWRTKLPKPVPVAFTADKTYFWMLDTDKGKLKIALRPDVAPMHVTSTIYLTLLGFYDTLNFHRIIKGFMAQGGDPLGNGKGGPGYAYKLEVSTAAKHDARGVLSMANAGKDTEGSQFFLTFTPQPKLDGSYSVFGKVVEGDATLTAMEAGGTVGEGTPVKVTIVAATVVVQ